MLWFIFFFIFSLSSSVFLEPCDHENRQINLGCFVRRLRADYAIEMYLRNASEEHIEDLLNRCGEFLECVKPKSECKTEAFNVVAKWCEKFVLEARVAECHHQLVSKHDTSDEQAKITDSFAECYEAGLKEGNSKCSVIKSCTEELVEANCHESVFGQVTFFDSSDCSEDQEEGSGEEEGNAN